MVSKSTTSFLIYFYCSLYWEYQPKKRSGRTPILYTHVWIPVLVFIVNLFVDVILLTNRQIGDPRKRLSMVCILQKRVTHLLWKGKA